MLLSTLPFLIMPLMASAHMEMKSPTPFRSKYSSLSTSPDYDMTNPLSKDGSNFPCKGYETLLSDPEGASVATWSAGTTQQITITGGAIHGGGSCQFSMSYDKGASWHVIHSIIGNCPASTGDSTYQVPIPTDAPPSDTVLFAWTWYNKLGNREVYGNCAHVTVTGSGSTDSTSTTDALAAYPAIFRANMNTDCTVTEGTDVLFPNPGNSVDKQTAGTPPSGSCDGGDTYGGIPGSSVPTTGTSWPVQPTSSSANIYGDATPLPPVETSSADGYLATGTPTSTSVDTSVSATDYHSAVTGTIPPTPTPSDSSLVPSVTPDQTSAYTTFVTSAITGPFR